MGEKVAVDARRAQVRDFLAEPPLGNANILNPPHQFIEITEGLIRVPQPLVIEKETLHASFAGARDASLALGMMPIRLTGGPGGVMVGGRFRP
jgi:hypothetical protein